MKEWNIRCLKLHFLYSHFNFGVISNEPVERFHQRIFVLESRYLGQFNLNIIDDNCGLLQQETDPTSKRKNKWLNIFNSFLVIFPHYLNFPSTIYYYNI